MHAFFHQLRLIALFSMVCFSTASIVRGAACPVMRFLGSAQADALIEEKPVGRLTPTGERNGTTGGSWYRDEAGQRWFLKPDSRHAELQSSAEVISSHIYRFLGYEAPVISIVTLAGKRYAASKSLGSGLTETTLSGVDDRYFRQLRYFAAFLGDRDRLRLGPNNAFLPSGRYALFDFGGTLGARAQGEHKPGVAFSAAVGAWDAPATLEDILASFRVSDLPAAHPWRQPLSTENAAAVLRKLRKLDDSILRAFVKMAHYSSPRDEQYMIATLVARRDVMIAGLTRQLGNGSPAPATFPSVSRAPDLKWGHAEALQYFGSQPVRGVEEEVLSDYVNDRSYRLLNPIALGRDVRKDPYLSRVILTPNQPETILRRDIPVLDRIIASARSLPNGLVLYRGKVTHRQSDLHSLGEVFEDRTFVSTSVREEVSTLYVMKGLMEKPPSAGKKPFVVLTTLRVSGNGVKGLFIPSVLNRSENALGNSLAQTEDEVLLKRGLHYRVAEQKQEELPDRIIVTQTLEVMP